MAICKECRFFVQDTRATDYRRDNYEFCSAKGPFFSRNYRMHEGTRISANDTACENFDPSLEGKTFAAVIVAAGGSTRMGGGVSKVLRLLAGEPVLLHTLRAFDACGTISRLVVVARQEDHAAMEPILRHCKKPCSLVCGGATRQESVTNGIRAAGNVDYYAIHDGARPMIQPAEITQVCADAVRWGAASLAVPVKDTCKLADANGFVTATPDRSALWAVQTPQVFDAQLYCDALEKSRAAGLDFTDDCQLVEYVGKKVHLCRGSYENFKLTTPEDMVMAEAILARRPYTGKERKELL